MLDHTFEIVVEKQYFKKIQDVLVYGCVVCNTTWFKIDVIEKQISIVSKIKCVYQK